MKRFDSKVSTFSIENGASNVIDQINGNIFNVVSNYIELKRTGTSYSACCPFHEEKTPSFNVSPAKGIYKCFGCEKGGDAIEFIKQYEGVDFKQAVELGAKKLNIDFEWNKSSDFDQVKYRHQESLRIACSIVERFYADNLSQTEAQKYIKSRNIVAPTDGGINIGYAPEKNALLAYAKEHGVKTEILEEIGLLKSGDNGHYDFFRNRLIFPISNAIGQTIGFAGRDLTNTSKVKYMNSPESSIYVKGKELYALNAARQVIKKEDRVYIVEGYTDALRMHSIGIINTVATCGTALTDAQVNLLKRYTDKVTLVFDGDKSGQKATDRNAEMLIENQFHVSVIVLPEKDDPDTLFANKEIFLQYNEKASNYVVYKTLQCADKSALDPVFKSETIKQISKLISNYNKSNQEIYIGFAV